MLFMFSILKGTAEEIWKVLSIASQQSFSDSLMLFSGVGWLVANRPFFVAKKNGEVVSRPLPNTFEIRCISPKSRFLDVVNIHEHVHEHVRDVKKRRKPS